MQDIICTNCGSINDYNVIVKSNQHTAYCNGCKKYIKNIPQEKTENLTMYFGKFKGQKINEIQDKQYLEWVLRASETLNEKYRTAIQERIDDIEFNSK